MLHVYVTESELAKNYNSHQSSDEFLNLIKGNLKLWGKVFVQFHIEVFSGIIMEVELQVRPPFLCEFLTKITYSM